MTDFNDLLLPQAISIQPGASTKKALFLQLGGLMADAYGLDAKIVSEALLAREKLGSTGFGGGVAIPHAKAAPLGHVVGAFIRLAQPVDFQAVDDLPVDLVFALLSPPDAGAVHLKALARVSRGLRDPALTAKLRGAGSPDALFALLVAAEARDAA